MEVKLGRQYYPVLPRYQANIDLLRFQKLFLGASGEDCTLASLRFDASQSPMWPLTWGLAVLRCLDH